jgi:hypothetical protein
LPQHQPIVLQLNIFSLERFFAPGKNSQTTKSHRYPGSTQSINLKRDSLKSSAGELSEAFVQFLGGSVNTFWQSDANFYKMSRSNSSV